MSSSVAVQASSSQMIWKIENFSKLSSDLGYTSDVFSVGTSKWEARIFPKGEGSVYDHLSLCLIPDYSNKSSSVEFSFEIVSQSGRKSSKKRKARYNYTQGSGNGQCWRKFMRLSELHDPKKGYIVDDSCVIRVEVTCKIKEDLADDYNSSNIKEIETHQTRLGRWRLFSPLRSGAKMLWDR